MDSASSEPPHIQPPMAQVPRPTRDGFNEVWGIAMVSRAGSAMGNSLKDRTGDRSRRAGVQQRSMLHSAAPCLRRLGGCRQPLVVPGAHIGDVGFAQIEIALDAPPCLVLQLVIPIKLVDRLAFGRDQYEIDFVVKLAEFLVAALVAEMLHALEAAFQLAAKLANDVVRQSALLAQFIEARHRGMDRGFPRNEFFHPVGTAFAAARMVESERTDHEGKRQTLADQR